MSTYKYLKDEFYYCDLYDRYTVEECRRIERNALNEQNPLKRGIIDIRLYFYKGNRYARKQEIIRDYMDRDKRKDEKLANAPPPENILCNTCNIKMHFAMKDLYWDNNRVLFFFECLSCKKRKAIFDNGEEFKTSPLLCPKCHQETKTAYSRKGEKLITTYKCTSCLYRETDIIDLVKKEEEKVEPNFEKDRQRFCLSDKEGQDYIWHTNNLNNFIEREKERENNKELYNQVVKINKLNIAQLKKVLLIALGKNKYVNLEFLNPEFNKHVIVNFTIQDNKETRNEYDSRNQIKRLIIKVLTNTNWRLMTEGITYRLGILTGRLKGYENEANLIELLKNP